MKLNIRFSIAQPFHHLQCTINNNDNIVKHLNKEITASYMRSRDLNLPAELLIDESSYVLKHGIARLILQFLSDIAHAHTT